MDFNLHRYMKKYFAIFLLFGFFACSKPDLALINQVKQFESQWANMNTKLTFIERNLGDAAKKYPSHLQELRQFSPTKAGTDTLSTAGSFDIRYKKMMLERDKMELEYKTYKARFEKEVKSFNDWNKDVMNAKMSKETAQKEFEAVKQRYSELDVNLDSLRAHTVQNIDLHNKLTRDYAHTIGNFSNYNMIPH